MIGADRVRLPVHPELPGLVTMCLAEGDVGSSRLWMLVGKDPAVICRLFRAANSSFYAGLPKTLSVEEAVTRLGCDQAVRIVEETCLNSDRSTAGELVSRYLPGLWQHAQGCALGARWLARRCGYPTLADQAYCGGLLHDIGKFVLLAALQTVAGDEDPGTDLPEALVREVMSTMHVEQGVHLFDEWNLPEVYRSVVQEHHVEELEIQNTIVALVKLANKGCRKIGLGLEKNPDLVLPTTGEAQFLGIDEIALAEFEIMLEDRFF
jgi:putative nucleotidyltransferase with HDIG domain